MPAQWQNNELLFVYGTLRQGARSPMHTWLAQQADFVSLATYQGRLYMVSWYPAAVPSDDPADKVIGELYRLKNPDKAFASLDRYEGCDPDAPGHSDYIRRIETVRLPDGGSARAWVYLYNRPTDGLTRIRSGDFLNHRRVNRSRG